jgi:hypothetical protein
MFLSAVSILIVAQPSSEVPEGLMNCPVSFLIVIFHIAHSYSDVCVWSIWLGQTFFGINTFNPEVKNGCVIS